MNNIEKVRKHIEEQKLMETWELRPGAPHFHEGHYFKFAVANEPLGAGSLLQLVSNNPPEKEHYVEKYEIHLPVETYPYGFVLHDVPKGAMFWVNLIYKIEFQ
ncbi:MAG TPA: hypothetical protein VII94_00105 [Candidatus Saccharimonadales bacterium]